jgi:hypothetical protein
MIIHIDISRNKTAKKRYCHLVPAINKRAQKPHSRQGREWLKIEQHLRSRYPGARPKVRIGAVAFIHRSALKPVAAGTAQGPHPAHRLGARRDRVMNLRYAGTVEDEVYAALSERFRDIFEVLGQLPDSFEEAWIKAVVMGPTSGGDDEAVVYRLRSTM